MSISLDDPKFFIKAALTLGSKVDQDVMLKHQEELDKRNGLTTPNTQPSTPVGKFSYKPAVTFRKLNNPEEDTLDRIILKPAYWKFDDYQKAKAELKDYIKAQRQADIEQIAFHFGLPVKDIEKVLESKESV